MAFQYLGEIYYRVMKDIPAGSELLVWYGGDYGKELGITKNTQLSPWQIHRHPGMKGRGLCAVVGILSYNYGRFISIQGSRVSWVVGASE